MQFATAFDETIAKEGPAAVFLPDRHGCWRLDERWTRDAWGRLEQACSPGWTWLLLRDHVSGFVNVALVTSPDLLQSHPRLDVRRYASLEEANLAREAFGHPALCHESWA